MHEMVKRDFDYAIAYTHREFKEGKISREKAKHGIDSITKAYKTGENNKSLDRAFNPNRVIEVK